MAGPSAQGKDWIGLSIIIFRRFTYLASREHFEIVFRTNMFGVHSIH